MEVAVIDWNSINSRFIKDDLYEHINAPKWVDFAAPEVPVDDEAWFCRPGCNHPKTVEDFFAEKQGTPPISKDKKSGSVLDVSPLGDRNKREATLKKRGGVVNNQPFGLSSKGGNYTRIVEDGENQDPNLLTPQNRKARAGKDTIKSSTEKKDFRDDTAMGMGKEQMPKLRSTLSARNLFNGGDFLSKVAEFCNELKKLAIRAKDKDNAENVKARADGSLGFLDETERERKPLLAVSNEKRESESLNTPTATPTSQTKLRKKIRNNNAENTPVSIDMNKIKPQEAEEGVLQIRTCPPTPQCFSAGCAAKDMPPKRIRPKPPLERGILQELKQTTNKEATTGNNNRRVVEKDQGEAVKEAKALDVFWFLKPCTTLSS